MSEIKTSKVKSIKKGPTTNVYDIGVEKNHNFFANGMLVSNCFQEDFMLLAQKMGGFTPGESDKMRKVLVKKSHDAEAGKDVERDKMRKKFIEGAKSLHGIDEKTASAVFDKIEYFAGYGFNKSLYFLEEVDTYSSSGTFKGRVPIRDVTAGDYLKSRCENSKKSVLVEVLNRHDHGVLDLVEVELTTGEKVKCTWDHKFRTLETGEMLPLWEISKKGLSIVVERAQSSTESTAA